MIIMHLSDLHLGKRVNEYSMIEDQRYILLQILHYVDEEKPDALVIAGDIFDRSVPPEDAVTLWDDFLSSLAKREIPVYAIYGNHDSAVRFSEHSRLLKQAGIHLSPVYDGKAQHFAQKDAYGTVHFFLLPFVKPSVMRQIFPEEEISDYTDVCRLAVSKMDIDLAERNVILAHQFVTGASRCESEEILIGTLDNVDGSVFDAFDYVALGHLHGKQKIGRETMRYCGTPLKYSFSERNHVKAITIVELKEKGNITISEIPLKPKHDLRRIKGTYENLTSKANYEGTAQDDYIHAVLTDEQDVPNAQAKLRVIYPNLMKLSYDNMRTRENRLIEKTTELEQKTPLVLFEDFYELQNNVKMTEEQKQLTQNLIESIWEDE